MQAPPKSRGPSDLDAFLHILTVGAQSSPNHTAGGVRMIDPFA